MIRTRQQWWDWCMKRGTHGGQVFDILPDWKESNEKLASDLTEIRDIARSGLPAGGMTEEQRRDTIADKLTRLIDRLSQ